MKPAFLLQRLAYFLGAAITLSLTLAAHAQSVYWSIQDFDGTICGLESQSPITLVYDPSQDNTGDKGGSCYISVDYSQSDVFQFTANNEACCGCRSDVILQLSAYSSIEFDVKWDNSSAVPLSYFNTNSGNGSPGFSIGDLAGSFCYSNVIIPEAATNGWVHISAAINRTLTNVSFVGLNFQKSFPAYGASNSAAFWLDNLQLVGPTIISPVLSSSLKGSNFTFTFPAIYGANYSVFKSPDLVNWTNLVTGYPGLAEALSYYDTNLSFTDSNATGTHAYYIIRRP